MNQLPDFHPPNTSGAKTFRKDMLVRFSDCDPAGIVFYPKYFEMFNSLIEDWCRDELSFSFVEIVARRGWGLPTVRVETDFLAPSTYGELLQGSLLLRSLGKTSITLEISFRGPDGDLRVEATIVLVLIDRTAMRAIPFPNEVRQRLAALLPAAPDQTVSERP